jgi:hypothetical protein
VLLSRNRNNPKPALPRQCREILDHLTANPGPHELLDIAVAVGAAYSSIAMSCRLLAAHALIERLPDLRPAQYQAAKVRSEESSSDPTAATHLTSEASI